MSGNATFSLTDTAIVSVTAHHAPEVITSAALDERIMHTYERLGTQPGLLESLAGISERRWWPEGHTFTEAAAEAGRKAMDAANIRPDQVGLLIDTSVSRDRLEPSSAVTVHHLLNLPSSCLNFDLANACLGFMNAMQVAGMMLDSHQIDFALIVDGEGSRQPQEKTLERLASDEATVADLFADFATLTLGSGAAGMVLGRHSENAGSHKILGGINRANTSHHTLCVGTLDQMRTDTAALLAAGLDVSELAWANAEENGWLNMDRYVIHQISSVHTSMLCERLGIDVDKVPLTYPKLGNTGPAAVPLTLAQESESLNPGDRVLCLGMGSGINAMALEILW